MRRVLGFFGWLCLTKPLHHEEDRIGSGRRRPRDIGRLRPRAGDEKEGGERVERQSPAAHGLDGQALRVEVERQ